MTMTKLGNYMKNLWIPAVCHSLIGINLSLFLIDLHSVIERMTDEMLEGIVEQPYRYFEPVRIIERPQVRALLNAGYNRPGDRKLQVSNRI